MILPMCVLRRMDAVLEPTKQAVLDTKRMLDEAGITEQRAALADAAGQVLYDDACGTGGMFTVAEQTLATLGNECGLPSDGRL